MGPPATPSPRHTLCVWMWHHCPHLKHQSGPLHCVFVNVTPLSSSQTSEWSVTLCVWMWHHCPHLKRQWSITLCVWMWHHFPHLKRQSGPLHCVCECDTTVLISNVRVVRYTVCVNVTPLSSSQTSEWSITLCVWMWHHCPHLKPDSGLFEGFLWLSLWRWRNFMYHSAYQDLGISQTGTNWGLDNKYIMCVGVGGGGECVRACVCVYVCVIYIMNSWKTPRGNRDPDFS